MSIRPAGTSISRFVLLVALVVACGSDPEHASIGPSSNSRTEAGGGVTGIGGGMAMSGGDSASPLDTARATGGASATTGGRSAGGAMGGRSSGGVAGANVAGTLACDVSALPANVAAWIDESWSAEGRNNMPLSQLDRFGARLRRELTLLMLRGYFSGALPVVLVWICVRTIAAHCATVSRCKSAQGFCGQLHG